MQTLRKTTIYILRELYHLLHDIYMADSRETRSIELRLGRCWIDVVEGGPALAQHRCTLCRVNWAAAQSRKPLTTYFSSKQLLPFGFEEQYSVMPLAQHKETHCGSRRHAVDDCYADE